MEETNKIPEIYYMKMIEGSQMYYQWYVDDLQQENEQLKKEIGTLYMMKDVDKISELQQENETLKKRIEEITRIGLSDHRYASNKEDEAITLQMEKAELIEWLEKEIKDTFENQKLNETLYSDVYLKYTSNLQEEAIRIKLNKVLNKIKGDSNE